MPKLSAPQIGRKYLHDSEKHLSLTFINWHLALPTAAKRPTFSNDAI
jgi:hypothetical protein